MSGEVRFDFEREQRIGVAEAVLCEGKTVAQINLILEQAAERKTSLLLTRLSEEQQQQVKHPIDYDSLSRTAIQRR